ncbi:MAG: glycosyltransferase family 2 protein [Methylovulum sp.]|nr:glycosyltransferase family 2 protein [Methylovulum sp.]
MQPLVHIIILNWNDYKKTISCIKSLDSLKYHNFETIVIDNGSTNESIEILSQSSNIELKCNSTNLGFTGGNNGAMEEAINTGADYVWLLNNDATVEPDCLDKLVNAAENDKNIGLLSPVIYEAGTTDKIQNCGTCFDLSKLMMEETTDILISQQWQKETPYNIILWGTALLIPKHTIKSIGTLDERFFAYAEDLDYSIRSAKAGYKNITVYDAKIWHEGHTGHRKPYYYYYTNRNSLFLWKKHLGFTQYIKRAWWNIDRTNKRMADLNNQPELISACVLGCWDGLCGVGGEFNSARNVNKFIKKIFSMLS